MAERIFAPLGIKDLAFSLPPSMRERLATIHQAQFGIEAQPILDTDQDVLNYLSRMVCAARQYVIPAADGLADHVPHTIGGFLQTTAVKQQGCYTSIVHRWPDVIGEPIDPGRGDAMPAFLATE